MKVNRAFRLLLGSVGRSTISVSGAPGVGPLVQTTPKHWVGSALPVAEFPPPSTFPGSTKIPHPSLRLAVLFETV